MKKKKKLFAIGTLAIGMIAITAPLNSIASEVVEVDGPLFGEEEPTVYDVPNNPDFVVNKTVNGSNLTLTWEEVDNAERYFLAKFYKVDSEYVLEKEPQYVTKEEFIDTIVPSQDYIYRIAPEVEGVLDLDYVAVVTVSSNEGPNEETGNEQKPNDEENPDKNEEIPSEEVEERPKNEAEIPKDEGDSETDDSDIKEGKQNLEAKDVNLKNDTNKDNNKNEVAEDNDDALFPEGDNNTSNGEVIDPTVPRTGDGSVQKVISPLVISMLALVVAFILVPNRKSKNA
ncbi:hypothetical protein [Virgibacillus halodenitrificans]|uniref:hypothetical protein n=1 Tax=Virgibacillus halodenitrificans TaxID=1482 RepID=UPI000EF4B979|nr:hypothetical protein [Virgibacillus halodenitrificans]